MGSGITCFRSTNYWKAKCRTSMCLDLSIVLLELAIIIALVLSQNNFLGTCIYNSIFSRMKEIYFAALSPYNVAINSALVELVATVSFILLF